MVAAEDVVVASPAMDDEEASFWARAGMMSAVPARNEATRICDSNAMS